MKTSHYVIVGGVAVTAIGIVVAILANALPSSGGVSYSEGDFRVSVIEDTSSRFLARVENSGPALSNAAAFAVRKGLNENCEPQGIVVANFQVRSEGGRLVPNPDSIPGNGSVTLDSKQSNISVIPSGPEFETAVYILRLEPGSIRASQLIQKIPIQQLNSSELEMFESCAGQAYGGYPVQLRLLNPKQDMQAYITLTDASARYETALAISPEAPDASVLFWPASRNDWLSANYTQVAGPAPAWYDTGRVLVSVSVVSQGQVSAFEDNVAPRLATTSLDFFELAKGNPLPSYPRYWEIQVNLANGTIS